MIAAETIEKGVLGVLLTFPEGFQIVRDEGISKEDFALPAHRKIFGRMTEYGETSPEMLSTSLPEEETVIVDLIGGVVTSAHLQEWCQSLKEYTARRKVMTACQKMIEKANDRETPFLPEIMTGISSVLEQQTRLEVKKTKSMEEVFADYVKTFDPKRAETDAVRYGLPTDRKIRHCRGEIFTLGAAPGTGKTNFALSAMLNMARAGKKVALFCQEMPTATLIARMVSNLANIPVNTVLGGDERDARREAEKTILDLFRKRKMLIRGNGEYIHSVSGIETELHKFYNDAGGLDWYCVDYIQTVRGTGKEKDPRERIDCALEGIKELAAEYNCACLLLSQLSRSGQQEKAGLDLTALKESGHIEEVSSIVAFLQRRESNVAFRIVKNRNGQAGISISLLFEGQYSRFSEHTYNRQDAGYEDHH